MEPICEMSISMEISRERAEVSAERQEQPRSSSNFISFPGKHLMEIC